MERGRRYADEGLWAKAAVHFRRAAYQLSENVDAHLSLAVAYINLNMYDMALEPLEKARELDRLNPKIDELAAILEAKRNQV
jgi:tetratricopeptide (TPR) repeat protein